jgi:[phosphatase 2A protein]-leucine-carboxy methyltransferase
MDWRKIVQDTAFDAVEAKSSALAKGYYVDPFIRRFLVSENPQPPHLNYLYYLRTTRVLNFLLAFHDAHGPRSQVVVLGCGYDTLFWRLIDAGVRFAQWFDLDLPEVIVRKTKLIAHDPPLTTEGYRACSIDLRRNFGESLAVEGFDSAIPTAFVDEFSMIYIESAWVSSLLKFVSSLNAASVISIGVANMGDDFGRFWIEAFRDNNTPLRGLEDGPWEGLFERAGFSSVDCSTFENEAKGIGEEEAERVRQIEAQVKLDELECLLRHYVVIRCATVGRS